MTGWPPCSRMRKPLRAPAFWIRIRISVASSRSSSISPAMACAALMTVTRSMVETSVRVVDCVVPAAAEPEPGAQFVRQGLVLEHARLLRVPDGSFVQIQRGKVPTGDALNLRRQQQRLAEKVLRAVFREDRKRGLRRLHLLQIGPSLILSGIRVSRGRRETIPEIELDGPDRPRQMVHHVACDAGGVPRPSVLAKHVAEL